jgi:hypothetical protein
LGDKQEDQMQGHYHDDTVSETMYMPPSYAVDFSGSSGKPLNTYPSGTVFSVTGPVTDGTNGTPRTGTETRESRIGINYIIKL